MSVLQMLPACGPVKMRVVSFEITLVVRSIVVLTSFAQTHIHMWYYLTAASTLQDEHPLIADVISTSSILVE